MAKIMASPLHLGPLKAGLCGQQVRREELHGLAHLDEPGCRLGVGDHAVSKRNGLGR